MRDVTAAILVEDGRVLIARRPPGDHHAGKWEFPGGKVEPGESPEACLQREMREEFEVDVEVLEAFGVSEYHYDRGAIRLLAYAVRQTAGEWRLHSHDRVERVTFADLDGYDFLPADWPLVRQLQQSNGVKR